jgi:putative endonuclease
VRGTRALGERGEALAADFIRRAGLEIVARNWCSRLGEIDLVAREAGETVFIEVKTRVGGPDAAPDAAVTAAKLERLGRLAEAYLAAEGRPDAPWRVDVVAIVLDGRGAVRNIDHLRGAFL